MAHREVGRQEARAAELYRDTSSSQIPHKRVPQQKIELVGRSRKGAYDDEAPMKKRRWIPEAY